MAVVLDGLMLAFIEREELKTAVVDLPVSHHCPDIDGVLAMREGEVEPDSLPCSKFPNDGGSQASFAQIAAQAPRRI